MNPPGPAQAPSLPRVRLYEPADEAAAYEVCLKTGDAGQDATHLHDDPRALGSIYVGAYLQFEPAFALLLEDAQGVAGYCLGALDTPRFFERYVNEWLPPLRRQHPEPTGNPDTWTPTQRLYYEYYHPDLFHPEPIRQYPSHMHIDLLPRAQGKGWGKIMVSDLLARLRAAGSAGVHLGMWARNERAYRFYRGFGFHELLRVGEGERASVYLGIHWPT